MIHITIPAITSCKRPKFVFFPGLHHWPSDCSLLCGWRRAQARQEDLWLLILSASRSRAPFTFQEDRSVEEFATN